MEASGSWTAKQGRSAQGSDMKEETVELDGKQADGYVIPLGPVNVVCVVTDGGLVGCGAFDVAALDKFDYPAATVCATRGDSVATVEDVLVGAVRKVNKAAARLGLAADMSGRDALLRMAG